MLNLKLIGQRHFVSVKLDITNVHKAAFCNHASVFFMTEYGMTSQFKTDKCISHIHSHTPIKIYL